ncbi:MAG: ATP-binding protein [Actinomycetales bacterium]|nr:ATP-binding protein [Actinomycetales bacterium]
MARVIVVCGVPGSGKSTLASALAAQLQAAYLRVDVVETPLILAGVDVGPLGYQVVQEVAASNLALGIEVVIDLVDPWPETRRRWRELAARSAATLVVLECVVPDPAEHRRRVEARRPDLPGQVVPTWEEVTSCDYVLWDEERDGPRTIVDMTDTATAVTAARSRLSLPG